MRPFEYLAAPSVASAFTSLQNDGASSRPIAGGTNLLDLMKNQVENPARLVDVNALPLTSVTEENGGLKIGAGVRNSDLAQHPLVKARYPVLSEALLSGASPQLRNMATTAGNLMQRTRCPYFRDVSQPCNKRDPGTGCSALQGFNRMHAVLGTSEHCIAANPSDMNVALVALDATVHLQSSRGTRTVPVTDFHLLPGAHPERETVLAPGELISAITLPPSAFSARSRYLKVRDRASFAFALASAAVALDLQGGVIREVRIALGGVGTKPWRAKAAEAVLRGKRADELHFKAAAAEAVRGARTHGHNAFKVELAKRTLLRALALAAGET